MHRFLEKKSWARSAAGSHTTYGLGFGGMGLWVGVRGLGSGVLGVGVRVWGLGVRVWGLGIRVWGLGLRVGGWGLRLGGWSLGFWVWGLRSHPNWDYWYRIIILVWKRDFIARGGSLTLLLDG